MPDSLNDLWGISKSGIQPWTYLGAIEVPPKKIKKSKPYSHDGRCTSITCGLHLLPLHPLLCLSSTVVDNLLRKQAYRHPYQSWQENRVIILSYDWDKVRNQVNRTQCVRHGKDTYCFGQEQRIRMPSSEPKHDRISLDALGPDLERNKEEHKDRTNQDEFD